MILYPGKKVWVQYEESWGTVISVPDDKSLGIPVKIHSDGIVVSCAEQQLFEEKIPID